MTPYRPVSRTGGFRVSISRRELRWLARASRGEGKRLARRVRRGELDRSVVEAAAEQFPTDAEPRIALAWLDRWGITSAEGGPAGPCASAQPGSSPPRPEPHGWTHPLCMPCFAALEPRRQPIQMTEAYRMEEVCCRCLLETTDGIYYRADPATLGCGALRG
jgi:hypothetical protein